MSALERLNIKPDASASVVSARSAQQTQTMDSFGFKWSQRDTYESTAMQEAAKKWLFQRYCKDAPSTLGQWLSGGRKIILDAGCGAGFSGLLFFGDHLRDHDYLGVDISNAVEVARQRFQEVGIQADFLRGDILDLPIPDQSIDIIFSEGVLHHTDSTERAIKSLARKLKPGGRLLFYVYGKKAIIREFTDDHIRQELRDLTDEQAWVALEPLTKLGMALGKLNVELDVPEDIPYLGIKKGSINLQRFFYWNICKLYYRPEFSLDEMNHINFDWFRPLNCHRQTPEEVSQWVADAGLMLEHLDVQESGITVVAQAVRGAGG